MRGIGCERQLDALLVDLGLDLAQKLANALGALGFQDVVDGVAPFAVFNRVVGVRIRGRGGGHDGLPFALALVGCGWGRRETHCLWINGFR